MTRPMTRTVWVGAVMLGLMATMTASTQPVAPKGKALPTDLAIVPQSAGMFVTVRVADLWASDLAKPYRALLDAQPGNPLKELEANGFSIDQIERATLVIPLIEVDGMTPLVIIAMNKPYDKAKLLTLLSARNPKEPIFEREPKREAPKESPKLEPRGCGVAEADAPDDALFYAVAGGLVKLILIDEKTFVLVLSEGPDNYALPLIAQLLRGKTAGALTDALTAANQKHHIVIGMNPPALLSGYPMELPAMLAPLKALTEAKGATLTFDLGEVTQMTIDLRHADAAMAKKASRTIDAFRVLAIGMMPGMIQEFTRDPEMKTFLPALREFEKSLDAATVEAKDDHVEIQAGLKLDSAIVMAIQTATQRVRGAAAGAKAQNNLKQIGLGMHSYHDANGLLPATLAPNAKYPVSWRVRILPYLEQDNLYRMYKFDEPWDSESNQKLIPLMPSIYELPGFETKEKGRTYFRVFQGPETLFPLKGGVRFTDVTDGLSNTLMVVEAAESVEWTRPDDLVYDPKKPVPKLGGHSRAGTQVLIADGSVRTLPPTISEKILRLLIERADGMVIPELDR